MTAAAAAPALETPIRRQIGAMTLTLVSDLEIEFTRLFAAPRDLVFAAYSRPEHVRRWWGLRGTTLVECTMDFRAGGAWRFVMRKEAGQEYAFRGEYREISAPERFVQTFEFEGAPGDVGLESFTFHDRGGETLLVATSHFPSREARDATLATGMENGAAETWDRLAELLAELAR